MDKYERIFQQRQAERRSAIQERERKYREEHKPRSTKPEQPPTKTPLKRRIATKYYKYRPFSPKLAYKRAMRYKIRYGKVKKRKKRGKKLWKGIKKMKFV